MQLTPARSRRIGAALCLITANLLSATAAEAQNTDGPPSPGNEPINVYDEPLDELGTTTVEAGVLYYQEENGRVQATEPMVSVAHTNRDGSSWSAKFTYDSLTGATPYGATPWTVDQDFVSAKSVVVGTRTTTGASGKVVTNPVTNVQEVIYTTPAGELPVNTGFKDVRYAVDLGYAFSVAAGLKLSLGGNGSREKDYSSYSGRVTLAQELAGGATTLSLGANYENDQITPVYGIPTALATMSGTSNNRSESKDVLTLLGGVTQVLTPNWLVQLNYSYTTSSGYQTDPYKIVSRVNPTTGAPLSYVYESRPDSRTRHALYAGTKLALGSFVTDISGRYYRDSWGIDAVTAQISERIPVGRTAYVEPSVRYYRQTAADFFTYALDATASLPQYASADTRLDAFSAFTFGISAGLQVSQALEVFANAETYQTSKQGAYTGLPDALLSLDPYAGANSISMMTGIKFKF